MAFQINASGTFQDDLWSTWHLFNHCLRLAHFPQSWKEAKIITVPKTDKDPKFPQNLWLISLLPTTGKLFEKVILQLLKNHTEDKGLLNASQFGFRAHHSTTLQLLRLTDHVTLNFNNAMSTAAVFLTLKKPLIPHGTQACYISYQNLNSRPDWYSWLALFSQNKNLEFWLKAKCPRQEKCKQGCHKVRSYPLLCIIFMLMIPPNSRSLFSPLCRWHLSICDRSQRGLHC
jgi:hypothetical protein